MIRVLVADDQELVREGLALILGAQPDVDVVGTASDGVEAVALARQLAPDVVLMDVRMPRLDGIQATRRIQAAAPGCRVLVLTTYDLDEHVLDALAAGASGYLLKDTPRPSLLAAVRAVAEGDVLLDPGVTRRLVDRHLRGPATPAARRLLGRLTPREGEVLGVVARGATNAEIAVELGIGEATVKTHVARLLEKLGARDRIRLVVLAHEAGLVGPPARPG
ncbi:MULTISPECIES: response regulator [unclassified Geodermatophilus]